MFESTISASTLAAEGVYVFVPRVNATDQASDVQFSSAPDFARAEIRISGIQFEAATSLIVTARNRIRVRSNEQGVILQPGDTILAQEGACLRVDSSDAATASFSIDAWSDPGSNSIILPTASIEDGQVSFEPSSEIKQLSDSLIVGTCARPVQKKKFVEGSRINLCFTLSIPGLSRGVLPFILGMKAPYHVHALTDELIYIREDSPFEALLYLGFLDAWVWFPRGCCVFIPKNLLHSWGAFGSVLLGNPIKFDKTPSDELLESFDLNEMQRENLVYFMEFLYRGDWQSAAATEIEGAYPKIDRSIVDAPIICVEG